MQMKRYIILFLMMISPLLCKGDEFRGIWVPATFVSGLSPESYEKIFDNLMEYNFNNIMFYTVNIGMSNYPSSYVPWNDNLTGTIGGEPEWNPLETAVKMAHYRNLLVHAKVNTYLAWLNNDPLPTSPLHPINTHPEWILVGRDGKMMVNKGEHLFFNPCHPLVQDWIYNYCLEIVTKYDVDGLHFDFIRFPNTSYSWDAVTLNRFWARFGKSPDELPNEWKQWRRDQITGLLIRIKTFVRRHRWNTIFGVDVWSNRTTGINYILQDMEKWLEQKILDFYAPMLYTTNLSSFQSNLQDHLNHSHGRFVFSGIAAHQMGNNSAYLEEQITASRDLATSGTVIYKYVSLFPDHIPNNMANHLKTNLFQNPAASVPYSWKTKTEFDPPEFEGLQAAEPRNNMAVLRWKSGNDETLPLSYTIYQSSASGAQEYTTPTYATQDTAFLVERLENGKDYHFVVRAEDDFANEDNNTTELFVTPSESSAFTLENFESGTNAYWNGNPGSGIIFQDPMSSLLTQGLDAASTLSVQAEKTYSGNYAASLSLIWTDPINGRCFLETTPDSPLCPDFTAWFSVWVHGENDGTRIAAVFGDTGWERTPYVTIDWNGWKKIEWFLPETTFTAENGGNGKLEDGVFGGEFTGLVILPGGSGESNLTIDDITNSILPDSFPPLFQGLQNISSQLNSIKLSWAMAMDASNPISYNIYMSSASDEFDFTSPTATTQNLEYTIEASESEPLYFIVRAQDRCGNEETNEVVKSIGPGASQSLENFESGSASYWNGNSSQGIIFQDPNYSGTTEGLDQTSRWEVVTTPTMEAQYAGKLYLKWNDRETGFCRITTHPMRPVISHYRTFVSAWIYGAGDNTRIALVLLDDLHEGAKEKEYEQSPYITIDWKGWRRVQWELMDIDWISWLDLGTGALEDPSLGGHLEALFFLPGDQDETTLYFDDISLTSNLSKTLGKAWTLY